MKRKENRIMAATKNDIIASLRQAYNMEVETVINYLANSLQLEGVRAEFIKQALATDIQEELGHAQQLGNRIKQLGGTVPGSLNLKMTQDSLTQDLAITLLGQEEAHRQQFEGYLKEYAKK